jgi:transposase
MHNDEEKARRDWRIPDALWERLEPLRPPRKPHPLGCHRPRVEDRQAMDAIFFVLRTGGPWNALHETGICSSSSAHRRFQEWTEAGLFLALWKSGLLAYEALQGIDGAWLARDGAMTKAPLGGEHGGQEPDRPRHDRHQAQRAHRQRWRAPRPGGRGRQSP